MRAGITASVAPSDAFRLEVRSTGTNADLIAGAKSGVLTALMCQGFVPVLGCVITLSEFVVDEVGSSYAAFYQVAFEATLELLGVGKEHEHNIAW